VIVDTHVHVACADIGRYPRAPRGVGSDWWRSGDHGGDALVATIARAGVDRAVVVQAVGPYGYDCRCATDAARADPDHLALVVAVDPDAPAPGEDLRAVARIAPVAGVRVFGVGGAPQAWLTDGRAASHTEAAGDLGVTVVPTVMPPSLAAIATLVGANPDVAVALDHAGFPDLPLTDDSPVLALAELRAVHLKVSSHLLEAAPDPVALVGRLGAAFGADRLSWGSDYPQTSLDYAALLGLGRAAAACLTPAERDAFLGGTAVRLGWG